jgi:hypothetical protein
MIKKILFFLFLIVLALILYLIFTSESVRPTDSAVQPTSRPTAALSDEGYRSKVKEIFNAYEELSRNNNLTAANIAEIKDKLIDFKGLPAKFKDLHINFVLAMDRAQDYLKAKDQQARDASQKIINQLKADYSWLNN